MLIRLLIVKIFIYVTISDLYKQAEFWTSQFSVTTELWCAVLWCSG